ncbi:testis-expressed protein 53 [Callorhinus ursinus]|uniref:Testis-expressed protein 53 n=1 Tax=Callorhinus ursinus TaxID=34884 RepID=A0A3Q7QD74_CALUR|nr:testis-expressed protein 53 [Callorhinus ursinus]
MASKIFCCCCPASEGSSTTAVSRSPRISQQHQPRSFNLNTDSRKNGFQKRYAHHPANNWILNRCTLGRP